MPTEREIDAVELAYFEALAEVIAAAHLDDSAPCRVVRFVEHDHLLPRPWRP